MSEILLFVLTSFSCAGLLAWRIRKAELTSLALEERHLEEQRRRALEPPSYGEARDLARKLDVVRSELAAMRGGATETASAFEQEPEPESKAPGPSWTARVLLKMRCGP